MAEKREEINRPYYGVIFEGEDAPSKYFASDDAGKVYSEVEKHYAAVIRSSGAPIIIPKFEVVLINVIRITEWEVV